MKRGLLPLNPSTPAPALNRNIDANGEFIAWATREYAAGNMDARDYDSFIGGAKADQSKIRLAHTVRELEELRSLVERQEKAIAVLTKSEQEARYASAPSAAPSVGRVRMPPDGGTH
jgi:hypothetical protein